MSTPFCIALGLGEGVGAGKGGGGLTGAQGVRSAQCGPRALGFPFGGSWGRLVSLPRQWATPPSAWAVLCKRAPHTGAEGAVPTNAGRPRVHICGTRRSSLRQGARKQTTKEAQWPCHRLQLQARTHTGEAWGKGKGDCSAPQPHATLRKRRPQGQTPTDGHAQRYTCGEAITSAGSHHKLFSCFFLSMAVLIHGGHAIDLSRRRTSDHAFKPLMVISLMTFVKFLHPQGYSRRPLQLPISGTPHPTPRTPHTPHPTPHTPHPTPHTPHTPQPAPHIPHPTLHTSHPTLHTLHTPHSTPRTPYPTPRTTPHCAPHIPHSTPCISAAHIPYQRSRDPWSPTPKPPLSPKVRENGGERRKTGESRGETGGNWGKAGENRVKWGTMGGWGANWWGEIVWLILYHIVYLETAHTALCFARTQLGQLCIQSLAITSIAR